MQCTGVARRLLTAQPSMRILVLSDVSSHMRGGVPTETRQLLRGLAARGHEVALAADSALEGVDAAHFPVALPSGPAWGEALVGVLRAFKPECVHVMAMGSRGVGAIAPVLRGRRWALTIHSVPPHERKLALAHGNEALHYGLRSLRFLANSTAWKWMLRRSGIPRVVVHSRFVQQVVERYGYPGEATLIALGFEPGTPATLAQRALRPMGSSPRFVVVGGLAHTKGQHDAVEAMARLKGSFPGLALQLIGELRDASYTAHLQALIERHGLQGQVAITPHLDEPAKQRALHAADFYLQPSHEEGFCLAYAEAAAVVPRLVGTDAGAIAAMSADDPGARVVAPRSPQAIACAVRELAAASLPADLLHRRSARMTARFSWGAYLDAHERLYDGLRG